ncbi:hypothetical protein [Mangrovicoccus sp. HB161399]|uniref:hypothetical protein n=1 Tax=Mangrovicoccus sp. HB161399 TaxID=2720392 RepID=UPI001557FF03|nr:hypothetical protein [Mangrovicoccus sp. HB161399]
MSETAIATLPDPCRGSPDPLTGVIRAGVLKLIEQAIEAELAALAGRLRRPCARGRPSALLRKSGESHFVNPA